MCVLEHCLQHRSCRSFPGTDWSGSLTVLQRHISQSVTVQEFVCRNALPSPPVSVCSLWPYAVCSATRSREVWPVACVKQGDGFAGGEVGGVGCLSALKVEGSSTRITGMSCTFTPTHQPKLTLCVQWNQGLEWDRVRQNNFNFLRNHCAAVLQWLQGMIWDVNRASVSLQAAPDVTSALVKPVNHAARVRRPFVLPSEQLTLWLSGSPVAPRVKRESFYPFFSWWSYSLSAVI